MQSQSQIGVRKKKTEREGEEEEEHGDYFESGGKRRRKAMGKFERITFLELVLFSNSFFFSNCRCAAIAIVVVYTKENFLFKRVTCA